MSQYQQLINELAKELGHREDLLDRVNDLVEKYEKESTPRYVIPVNQFNSDEVGIHDYFAQSNIKVSDEENKSLKGQNKRLKKIVKALVDEL